MSLEVKKPSTGVEGLDSLVQGGIPEGFVTVTGEPDVKRPYSQYTSSTRVLKREINASTLLLGKQRVYSKASLPV